MKYYLTLVLCLLTLTLKSEASCEGIYGSVLGGVNFLEIDKVDHFKLEGKTGYLAGAALGYKFNPYFRTELEVAYRGNKVKLKGFEDSFHSHLWTFMGNGIFEYPLAYGFTPYVGLGAGYGCQELKFHGSKEKDKGFVWQAIAGVSYKLCERTEIALDYRFLDAQKDADNHAICISLRQSF